MISLRLENSCSSRGHVGDRGGGGIIPFPLKLEGRTVSSGARRRRRRRRRPRRLWREEKQRGRCGQRQRGRHGHHQRRRQRLLQTGKAAAVAAEAAEAADTVLLLRRQGFRLQLAGRALRFTHCVLFFFLTLLRLMDALMFHVFKSMNLFLLPPLLEYSLPPPALLFWARGLAYYYY